MGSEMSSPQLGQKIQEGSARFSDFTLYPDRFEECSGKNSSSQPRTIPRSCSVEHPLSTSLYDMNSVSSSVGVGSSNNNEQPQEPQGWKDPGSLPIQEKAGDDILRWKQRHLADLSGNNGEAMPEVSRSMPTNRQYRFSDFSLFPDRFSMVNDAKIK